MKLRIIFSFFILVSLPSFATESLDLMSLLNLEFDHTKIVSLTSDRLIKRELPDLTNINWKVGDYQERHIKKGFLKVGNLKSWVDREEGLKGKNFWLMNELKIIFKDKQVIEALIERKTGKILKYIVDGEEQDPPDLTELEDCKDVGEAKETIKVPVGTFKATRTIIRCPDESVAIWVTKDKSVNMNGHIKQALLDHKKEDPDKPEYIVELIDFGTD